MSLARVWGALWDRTHDLRIKSPMPNKIAALQLLNFTYKPYGTLFILIRNAMQSSHHRPLPDV